MSNFIDVLRFHRKMGLPIGDFAQPRLLHPVDMRQRIDFMMEELMELAGAANVVEELAKGPYNRDMDEIREKMFAEIFDGLLDLVYVACGTGVMMGVPWEEGYALVQEANMKKERVLGSDDEHHLGVRKPAGWKSPDIKGLLQSVADGEVDISTYCLAALGADRYQNELAPGDGGGVS